MEYPAGNRGSTQERTGWGSLGLAVWVKIAVIGVLIWWFFRQEIDMIVHQWQADASWSHGFLIPFFSLYFVNQRKQEILQLRPRPNYLGLLLLIACFAFYVLDFVHFRIAYFRVLSIVPVLAGVALLVGGWKLLQYTWLPIVYLVFAFPLPDRLYKEISRPMRLLASQVSAALLNLVGGLEATASGVVIDIVYKGQRIEPPLNVAEACSGMRLLMAFLALGVAMAYLHYRPLWQRIVLLASTVPVAILCNIARVTITGLIYVLGDPKYAEGFYHDMLGIAMLPLAFALYGVLAWFMSNLYVDETAPVEQVVIRRSSEISDKA